MTKHTPGPWQVTPDRTRVQTADDAIDYQIADCEDTHFPPPLEQCEANARLIAAVPELLEALKTIIQAFDTTFNPERRRQVLEDAKQAIAKAEGK